MQPDRTSTYTLTARDVLGETTSARVTIQVVEPPGEPQIEVNPRKLPHVNDFGRAQREVADFLD